MIEEIKQIVKNYLNTIRPARLQFGIIKSIAPLRIQINEKLTLTEDFIIWPPALSPEDINKKALLIQQEGGQQYYILEVRP